MKSFAILSSLFLFASAAAASAVVELTEKNWDQYVNAGKPALVEFFAPWCGHCKTLAPHYANLADAFVGQKVVIASVDADGEGKSLGQKYGVKGYPTLKWFPGDGAEPIDYQSGRDLDALVAYITDKTGLKSKIKPPPPAATTQLDSSNFDEVALAWDNAVLVAFTAPWCGHCKTLKPTFEKVAQYFKNEKNVIIANYDADKPENKELAQRYGVSSFPTIKFFPHTTEKQPGVYEPDAYEGARSEEAFVDFLNKKAGTFRSVGGSLNELAGVIPSLSSIVPDLFSSASDKLTALIEQAQVILSGTQSHPSTAYYHKIIGRINEKGADAKTWAVKEQARLAKLLSSPSLAPTKIDEIKIKANILSSFLTKRAENIIDDVKGAFHQEL